MTPPPLFSVVIPVLNDSRWLPGAIDSVLRQERGDWELIVGDNASEEDVRSAASSSGDGRVHYHRWDERAELHENFNRTAALARGQWILPLGADDRLHPGCLGAMAERACATRPETGRLAMIVARCRRVTPDGSSAEALYYGTQPILPVADGWYGPAGWLRCMAQAGEPPWNIGSLAISRDVLVESGGLFRPEVGLCADNELALRAAAYGAVAYIDRPLLDYTVRSDSDISGRFERHLAERQPETPHGRAFAAGLRVHESRRQVSAEERRAIHGAIARSHLIRAGAHRFRPGGGGQMAAMEDAWRAFLASPRTVLTPEYALRALAAVLAPRSLLDRARKRTRERAHRPAGAQAHTESIQELLS